MKSMVKTKQMLAMLVFVTLIFLGCKKEDPKPLPPPPKPVITVTASATPSAIAFGAKSKIIVTVGNAASSAISLNGIILKTGGAGYMELETAELFATTTYQVTAKNADGSETKSADVVVTVAPIDPKLKLLLDGKWQLVKEERMRKWNGETSYSELPLIPCEIDNIYSFPTPTTCVVDWGALNCTPEIELAINKIYFEGYNPTTGILLWHGAADPYTVLAISETTLRIHKTIGTLGNLAQRTDIIKEYKNVK